MATNLKFKTTLDGEKVHLFASMGVFAKRIPPQDWLLQASSRQAATLSRILAWHADGEKVRDTALVKEHVTDMSLVLSADAVSRLHESEARAFGLPSVTPFALRLETAGIIARLDFRVDSQWMRASGAPVRATRVGAFLEEGGSRYRIFEPLYSVLLTAEALSGELPERERYERFSELKNHLGEDIAGAVDADGYLDEITIYSAAAFSLKLGVYDDDLEFDPVLFSKEIRAEVDNATEVDEEESSLLPPVYQELFARDRFRRWESGRNAYPLEHGAFVFIDPSLQSSLNIVRKAQSSDRETRRRFIANPQGFLKDKLPALEADVVDSLFIETQQYSERVTGVDIWRQPVLPWIRPSPNSWFPESFGLKIGDEDIELAVEDIVRLKKIMDDGKAVDAETVEFRDQIIPITRQASESIDQLAALLEEQHNAENVGDAGGGAPPTAIIEKHFLTVSENLEDLIYQPIAYASGPPNALPTKTPKGVSSTLKPHQIEGLSWLVESRAAGAPGVLLADDMGLGKTLQALSFLAWSKGSRLGGAGPTLIVAPTGLLATWKKEIEAHLERGFLGGIFEAFGSGLGALRVLNSGQGKEVQTGRSNLDFDRIHSYEVILTTYETMRDFHFSFASLKFSVIIFDEIQKLKNPASQLSRAARALNGDFLIGMTGTPVENHIQDLWSIMDVLMPGMLGSSKHFSKDYPATNPSKLSELRERLFERQGERPPAAIRRMKSDELKGLPEKREEIYQVEMPSIQANRYWQIAMRAKASADRMSPGDGILMILHELRGTSLHPIDPKRADSRNAGEYIGQSARIKQTFLILDKISALHEKVLLFVESLDMQTFLASVVQQRYRLDHRVDRINGKVSGSKRQEIVDRFQERDNGFDVLILSPKAGGVGLTLTSANHVIHVSRWWNPAVEDQCTDRVYRIGQQKAVTVHLPLAVHPDPNIREASFDLKLDALLRRKRNLRTQMLVPPENRDSDSQALFGDVVSSINVSTDGVPSETRGNQYPEHGLVSTPTPKYNKIRGAVKGVQPAVGPKTTNWPSLDQQIFQEGEPVDFDALFGLLPSDCTVSLDIVDPYCAVDQRSRRAMVEVISEIGKRVARISNISITHKPAHRIDNSDLPTDDHINHDLRGKLAVAFQSAMMPPKLKTTPRAPSKKRDFHDRFLIISITEEDSLASKWEYEISRGIAALKENRFRVSVMINRTPFEPQATA